MEGAIVRRFCEAKGGQILIAYSIDSILISKTLYENLLYTLYHGLWIFFFISQREAIGGKVTDEPLGQQATKSARSFILHSAATSVFFSL